MGKPSIRFFMMCIALLFALISFILVVFDLHRFAFLIELTSLILAIGLLFVLLSLRGKIKESGLNQIEGYKTNEYYHYIDKMEPEGSNIEGHRRR